MDCIAQAIRTAMAAGRPVKLTRPRAEGLSRDPYRPMVVTRVQITLDSAGNITA